MSHLERTVEALTAKLGPAVRAVETFREQTTVVLSREAIAPAGPAPITIASQSQSMVNP